VDAAHSFGEQLLDLSPEAWRAIGKAWSIVQHLRTWRRTEAASRGVPAYVVANDRALADIATRRPATSAGLLDCSGVGRTFVERYGATVIEMVAARATSRTA